MHIFNYEGQWLQCSEVIHQRNKHLNYWVNARIGELVMLTSEFVLGQTYTPLGAILCCFHESFRVLYSYIRTMLRYHNKAVLTKRYMYC